jgi:acyl carrier protein
VPADEAAIFAALADLIREVLGDDGVALRPETVAAEVAGWDSFAHLTIVVAAETRFGIKIPTREIERLTNVGDLARAIAVRLPAR